MARDAGAKKVYLASAAPPVRYQNVYGIDMPDTREFVAHGNTIEEIAEYIGVDWLIYQDLPDLIACASGINKKIDRFDTSIFDADYVTGGIDETYLTRLQSRRNDDAKTMRNTASVEVIELHNQA